MNGRTSILYEEVMMLGNYFKIAFRNLLKYRAYSFINICGLAVGIAFCILILLFVQDELSYDRHHERADRIFRVVLDLQTPGSKSEFASTPAALAPAMQADIPEVESTVRFYKYFGGATVSYGEKRVYEDRFFFADPSVFQTFSLSFLEGDPKTALNGPFKIVLTEAIAQKYFGRENPLGKRIVVNDTLDFQVGGIISDLPLQSHFRLDFLASFETWEAMVPDLKNRWAPHMYYTYVLLRAGVSASQVADKLPELVERRTNLSSGWSFNFSLQSLTDIHLLSHRDGELRPNGNIKYIYIFTVTALLILLIACVNFMNLATARSANRSREIGMRKVLGAFRRQLVGQFLGEALLLSFLATLLALLLAEGALPLLNQIAGKTLSLASLASSSWVLILTTLVILVGVVSGSYPAFFLSNFRITNVLLVRKQSGLPRSASVLRKALVIFQFAVSISLIVGTILTWKQLDFMQSHHLGFEPEQVVVAPVRNVPQARQKIKALKVALLQQPSVLNVTASNTVLGRGALVLSVRSETMPENEWQGMNTLFVEADFVETYKMEIVAGRDFSPEFADEEGRSFILNEAAVKKFGWTPESALGKEFALRRQEGRVVGVVRDFNYVSLHQEVAPLVLTSTPVRFRSAPAYISLRLRTDDLSHALRAIEDSWSSVLPHRPFDYFFLNVDFEKQYRAEQQFAQVFLAFCTIAIFIACLGLYGLTSFSTEQRTKEIGIRKVLGASVGSVLSLLSGEFVKLVLLANVLAWPIAWFAMTRWLQNFAYRIDIGVEVFLISGALALLITVLTVSLQAFKAAVVNPVQSLRYE
ncbi:ABC transporter permease [bacterium]|nr:ABC transporter permease [bacterium]